MLQEEHPAKGTASRWDGLRREDPSPEGFIREPACGSSVSSAGGIAGCAAGIVVPGPSRCLGFTFLLKKKKKEARGLKNFQKLDDFLKIASGLSLESTSMQHGKGTRWILL